MSRKIICNSCLVLGVLSAVSLGTVAQGQTRSEARAARTARERTAAPAVRASHEARSSSNNTSRVPGLGFDYVHLAAIGGANSGAGAATAPLNSVRHEHGMYRGSGAISPLFFGGYPYFSEGLSAPDYEPVAQPQIIVIQQPAAVTPLAPGAVLPASGSAMAVSPAPAEPPREVGEFVLVLRDGRLLFASAFTVVDAQLRYVSLQGITHTLPLSDLDEAGTQDMNAARGNTIELHR